MGFRNPFDPYGGATPEVDKFIGKAYPVVRAVSYYLKEIKYLAHNLDKLAPHEIEFRSDDTTQYVQWRLVARSGEQEYPWQNLVSFNELVGQDLPALISSLNDLKLQLQDIADAADETRENLAQMNQVKQDVIDLSEQVTEQADHVDAVAAQFDSVLTLEARLKTSAGGSAVAYQLDSTAVVRTLINKMLEIASVADFGALGDGVDDRVAIQKAIDWASDPNATRARMLTVDRWYSYSQGVNIDIGRGTNRRAGLILRTGCTLNIIGKGRETSGFRAMVDNPNYGGIWLQGATKMFMSNMGWDGRASTFNGYARVINGHGVLQFVADNVAISNGGGAMLDFETQLIDEVTMAVLATPVHSKDVRLTGSRLYNGYNLGIGSKLGGGNRFIVTDNLFEVNSNGGCVSFEAEETGGVNATMTWGEQCIVADNVFRNIGVVGGSQGSAVIITEKVRYINVADNNFNGQLGNTGAAIHISSSPDQTDADVSSVAVVGNIVAYANRGIDIDNNAALIDNLNISSNICYQCGAGIRLFYNTASTNTGKIDKLNIDGNNFDYCTNGIISFNTSNLRFGSVRISDNQITNITQNGIKVIFKHAQIVDNQLADITLEAIWMNGGATEDLSSDGSQISGNHIRRAGTGILVSSSRNIQLVGNNVALCTADGIRVRGAARTASEIFIDGNQCFSNGGWGVRLEFHRNVHLTQNNDINRNYSGGTDQNTKYMSSVIPTWGNYNRGEIVWNTAASSGGSIGWICITAGSMGAITGVTGSITTGTNDLTVTSVDGITVGDYITVDGAGITGARVRSITGLVVNLTTSATATVVDAAVSRNAAVFRTFATIATS